MEFIQATLRFYPNQANPARASGRGVYRVLSCALVKRRPKLRVHYGRLRETPVLSLRAPRIFKTGSRVDPTKMTLALGAV